MYHFFINQKMSLLKNTVWYSIGSLSYSLSSFILLIIVSRKLGSYSTGVFSIGWAISQLVYAIGLFGLRNFQVSDNSGGFRFEDYLFTKFFSIVFMFLGTIVNSLYLGLSFEKLTISMLLTCLMVSEVLADLFAGYFQTTEKLFIAGQSYLFRVIGYDIIFYISIVFTNNLKFSLLMAILFSFVWLFLFDFQIILKLQKIVFVIDLKKSILILRNCFPIFLSAFLTNYIVNIPKNNIELYSSENVQAVYNILSMPSSVITLMVSFIMVPLYTKITSLWNERKNKKLNSMIIKMTFLIFLISITIVILGNFFGLYIMSKIFGINLVNFSVEFTVLLIAGGINSLINLLVFLITVYKKQSFLSYVYILAVIAASLYTPYLVKTTSILGGAISYFLSVSLILFILIVIVINNNRKIRG
ncbi:lipopolysaccharide biosynthesis protein [Enterococcus italicus]|uniref:Polysaccharide biosynthesis protein n=1 Tax=Enterococcus italicus (strain DSM 15952 / CCUG 50447 / LMG 22039 / TP 1.5) TaxID=888064 RepID=E6LFH5_ENTI1|nr:hypothetical protein [Enterococcus italicus]EFU74045.1 hypothetical protein HMPREF9088_1115 [Enterococcus italicus DSM 15952]OJG60893.1 heteropolysaccharide repeat unit export protein [Enterococcus italicus DSM 15952]